jgi:hypothetical protein
MFLYPWFTHPKGWVALKQLLYIDQYSMQAVIMSKQDARLGLNSWYLGRWPYHRGTAVHPAAL